MSAFASSTASRVSAQGHAREPEALLMYGSRITATTAAPSDYQLAQSSLPADPNQPPRASSRPIRQAATRRQLKYADFEQLDLHLQPDSNTNTFSNASSASRGQALGQGAPQFSRHVSRELRQSGPQSVSDVSRAQASSQAGLQSARDDFQTWMDCFDDSDGEMCDFGCDTPANKRRKQHYPWSATSHYSY